MKHQRCRWWSNVIIIKISPDYAFGTNKSLPTGIMVRGVTGLSSFKTIIRHPCE